MLNKNSELVNLQKSSRRPSCLVIGGGISGLIAATVLQSDNINVTVVDKGRGIGGRMATRRISHPQYGEGIFDYGAQHFTVEDSRFEFLVNTWIQQGVVQEWLRGIWPSDRQQMNNPKTYYRGVKSNRNIAQHLAQNLNIYTQTRVISLEWQNNVWQVKTEGNQTFQADVLLLTPPIPQTLELLDRSQISLPPETRNRLEQIVYHRCITVLALLTQPSLIPQPGGFKLDGEVLSWIACNHKKGISPQANAVTLHASPEFSASHWETEDSVIIDKFQDAALPWLGSSIMQSQVHRWRFSQPQTVYGEPFLALTKPAPMVLCGDAFIKPDVEGAVLSGLAAADYLRAYHSS